MRPIKESVLNYVKATLDPGIWDLQTGRLKKDIHDQILNTLVRETMKANVDFDEKWKIYIIGSITGKQYIPTSDIDVTVDIGTKLSEEDWNKLKKYFGKNVNGLLAIGTMHPINYFFRRGFQVGLVDGAYDVVRDEWVVTPRPTEPFEPERVFREQFLTGKRAANMIIEVYEELFRDLKDLNELGEVMNGFYDKQYWNKSMEVWYDLNVLIQMYRQVKRARQEVFEKSIGDPQKSVENIVYKFLERYGYLDKLHKLFELRDDFLDNIVSIKEGGLDEGEFSEH